MPISEKHALTGAISAGNFGPRGWPHRLGSSKDIPAAGARTPIASAYNARVDRLDAIRLLRALVAAGAKVRAPMASAWVDEIAVRDMALQQKEKAGSSTAQEAGFPSLVRVRPSPRQTHYNFSILSRSMDRPDMRKLRALILSQSAFEFYASQ